MLTSTFLVHRRTLTSHRRNCVSNLLSILNCLTISRKIRVKFTHFATLKIAFLVTFLYIFLHNHKDMVNLKNIFFLKNHFLNFIIEKNGNFEGCLIGALDPMRIIISKYSKNILDIQAFQNISANSGLNLFTEFCVMPWQKFLGRKKRAIFV